MRDLLWIPLQLALWQPAQFQKIPPAQFQEIHQTFKIETDKTAGGRVFWLKVPIEKKAELAFEWNVERFPTAHYSVPLSRKEDDFAIRIGVLYGHTDSEKSSLSVAPEFEEQLKKQHRSLESIVFYVAVPQGAGLSGCFPSPYPQISYCPVEAGQKHSVFKTSVEIPAESKILGIWVFADSDNTKSASLAALYKLSISIEKNSPSRHSLKP